LRVPVYESYLLEAMYGYPFAGPGFISFYDVVGGLARPVDN
jgi:hypothetical protein